METKDLTLVVTEQRLGVLVTNALEIKKFVEQKLEGYSPENYVGRIAEAKADRAKLNKASKEINSKRLELEKSFMRPFGEFKGIIRETTDAIDEASKALDEIVKVEEEREREEKRSEIQEAWDELAFDVVPLDRIFDPRWLNKSASLSSVTRELEAKILQIQSDLKTLGAMEDSGDLQAVYLDTLDMGAAIRKATELKNQREAVKKYEEEQKRWEEVRGLRPLGGPEPISKPDPDISLEPKVIVPAEPEPMLDELETYTLRLTGTRTALQTLRSYFGELGITYEVVR